MSRLVMSCHVFTSYDCAGARIHQVHVHVMASSLFLDVAYAKRRLMEEAFKLNIQVRVVATVSMLQARCV